MAEETLKHEDHTHDENCTHDHEHHETVDDK